MKILLHWLILSVAAYATTFFVSGISIHPAWVALIVGACLAFINTIIKPIVGILTLPINIMTLGLFSLVLNALFFWLVANIISGFSVATFQAAFWGALAVSVINWIANKVILRE